MKGSARADGKNSVRGLSAGVPAPKGTVRRNESKRVVTSSLARATTVFRNEKKSSFKKLLSSFARIARAKNDARLLSLHALLQRWPYSFVSVSRLSWICRSSASVPTPGSFKPHFSASRAASGADGRREIPRLALQPAVVVERRHRSAQLSEVRGARRGRLQHRVHEMVPGGPPVALGEDILRVLRVAEEGRIPPLARQHAVRPAVGAARRRAVRVAPRVSRTVIRRERVLHVPGHATPLTIGWVPVHVVVLRAPVLVQHRRLRRHLPRHRVHVDRRVQRRGVAATVHARDRVEELSQVPLRVARARASVACFFGVL